MERKITENYIIKRLAIVFILFAVTTLYFYCKPWKSKTATERAEAMVNRISQELVLDSSQIKLLNSLKNDMLARQLRDQTEKENQFKEFATLFAADNIDTNKLTVLKKRHDALRARIETFFLQSVVQMHKALTPEQRLRAVAVMAKFDKKTGEVKQ